MPDGSGGGGRARGSSLESPLAELYGPPRPTRRSSLLTMQTDPAFAREAFRRRRARLRAQGGGRRRARRGSAPRSRGRGYLHPGSAPQLAAAPPEPQGPPDDLTQREVEILRLIALGHTNAEIGEQLYLSVRTVESHRAHIQQKLRRSTRAELVRYALDHGLLDEDLEALGFPATAARRRTDVRRPPRARKSRAMLAPDLTHRSRGWSSPAAASRRWRRSSRSARSRAASAPRRAGRRTLRELRLPADAGRRAVRARSRRAATRSASLCRERGAEFVRDSVSSRRHRRARGRARRAASGSATTS